MTQKGDSHSDGARVLQLQAGRPRTKCSLGRAPSEKLHPCLVHHHEGCLKQEEHPHYVLHKSLGLMLHRRHSQKLRKTCSRNGGTQPYTAGETARPPESPPQHRATQRLVALKGVPQLSHLNGKAGWHADPRGSRARTPHGAQARRGHALQHLHLEGAAGQRDAWRRGVQGQGEVSGVWRILNTPILLRKRGWRGWHVNMKGQCC